MLYTSSTYEYIQCFLFQIVAQETVQIAPKSSSADVTVYIRDVNDNFPEFSEDVYRVSVAENAEAGTVLTTISVSFYSLFMFVYISISNKSLQNE